MTAAHSAGHRVGLVGCGGFGSFVAGILTDERLGNSARLVVVADTDAEAVSRLTDPLPGVAAETDLSGLLSGNDVDLVVIATPPWTHADMAVQAIEAGCHVLVEKPLAIDLAGCRRVAAAASANRRVVAVDHMLRFAPLMLTLRRLLDTEVEGRRVLGPVRRFSFENDASDEGLPPEHWFWDPARSGGIFVEHGVHFFDLASWLIDAPPQAIQATALGVRGDRRMDTVCATAVYPAATATWYHSFSHERRAERQRLRVDLGAAECQLDGWIPLELRLDAWTDADGAAALAQAAAAGAVVPTVPGTPDPDREVSIEAGRLRLRLAHSGADAKRNVYAWCVAGVLDDLVEAIDRSRPPSVGLDVATAAVDMALAATESAALGRSVPLPSDRTE